MKKSINLLVMTSLIAPIIVAVPQPTDASVVKPFKDVSKNSPYYTIVHEMVAQGIISGYADGTFKPNQAITRKNAAALVSRAKGGSLPVKGKAYQFKDVSKNNAYYNDIRKLQQAGIFEPDKNGNFHPNKVVTRAEMAKILTIAFDLEVKANYDFPDVPVSHAANKYVRAIYSNGITTGDNGKFLPDESLTRVHFATFIWRSYNLDQEHTAKPTPEKPVVKPTPKPEPDRDTGVVTDKYDQPWDVPTPPGYKEDTFLAQQTKKHNDLRVQNKHGYNGAFALFSTESKGRVAAKAKDAGVTYGEMVSILDVAVKTGEVYDGGEFALFYNYKTGQVHMSVK